MATTLEDLMRDGHPLQLHYVLMGSNRVHCIGDTVYRFTPYNGFGDKSQAPMAIGQPVMWVDGKWTTIPRPLANPIRVEWTREVTPLN